MKALLNSHIGRRGFFSVGRTKTTLVPAIPSTRKNKRRLNQKRMTRKQDGFSLIELLIVVAIILIIAAISIPNLLRSRMAANEASAVGSIRTMIRGAAEPVLTRAKLQQRE
jgi:prepilin-type N-terminal cleavage/methylation domain-containing protein